MQVTGVRINGSNRDEYVSLQGFFLYALMFPWSFENSFRRAQSFRFPLTIAVEKADWLSFPVLKI